MLLTAYPSITASEFSEACAALETTTSDRLDDTDWVSLRWTGHELRLKQRRPARRKDDVGRRREIESTSTSDQAAEEVTEDDDWENIASSKVIDVKDIQTESIVVDFSITLSPTYSVPVLWFTSTACSSIDRIHEILLPEHLDEAVRSIGVMGGISQAYHPVTDLPAYFIHPCNTHEALLAINNGTLLSPEDYLLLWLGLIGSSVGLHVPSKLVSDK